MTAALDERVREISRRLGRPLTAAERHVDAIRIHDTLEHAKTELEQAIRAEQRHVARLIADGHRPALQVTDRMRNVLTRLRAEGQQHARAELASMGYPVRDQRNFAAGDDAEANLRARLAGLTVKIGRDALGGDITDLSHGAIARAVERVLGARGIAADLVSPVFIAGLGDVFEQHQDLVEAWQYTAVNDAAVCEECAPHDGEVYESWDAIQEVLPDGGPNPDCLGGGRCRCRAVPVPPEDVGPAPGPDAGGGPGDVVSPAAAADFAGSRALSVIAAQDALRALDRVHTLPAGLPPVRVASSGTLPERVGGQYRPIAAGGPRIDVARNAPGAGFTTLHEFGHYLSDAALGVRGELSASVAPELEEWRQAIAASGAVRQLVRLARGEEQLLVVVDGVPYHIDADPEFVWNYLLHPEELFARSYSQWAAMRSGDATLVRELARAGRGAYPEQWTTDDFQAIARAFDRLIERLGWRTGTT